MKIIQVCPRFLPCIGGIEMHVYEISRRLAKDNEVYVFTTDPSGKLSKEETIDGIHVRRFKSFAPNEAYFFSPDIFFGLRNESCDVLHIHSFQTLTSFFAYRSIKKSNVYKIFFTPHFYDKASTKFRTFLHRFYDRIQKQIFFGSDKVICVSRYEQEKLNKIFNIPPEKLVYIPNGLNLEDFQGNIEVKKNHDFEILTVNRLERYKNIHKIFPALKSLIEKHHEKDIHMTIVGKGPYEKALIKKIEDFDLRDHVSFEKDLPRKKLVERYKSADVFVSLSDFEVFGIVVFEALMSNTPAIVSKNIDFFKNIIVNGKNGFIIEDFDELEGKLEFFMKNKVSFSLDAKEYDWDEISKKTLNLYKGCKCH
jgi:glycosyltransferase involved in cell wall biosynthesis